MEGAEVLSALRGKVLEKPVNRHIHADHVVQCDDEPWTPYNANLSMQGIKVLVKEPLPEVIEKSDSFEDTLLLLNMVKERNIRNAQQKKEEMIRAMALEQKKKKALKDNTYIHRPADSNLKVNFFKP